eukprot:COSAG01_NODE_183_length_22835_cov_17.169247_11_plen_332_part_00
MKIAGIETYLPHKIVSNEDLNLEFPDWNPEKIESKVGISQRHVAEPNETAADLGAKAAEKLFETFDRTEVDFLLFCTQSPDHFLPTTACILQERLNLPTTCGALDFNLGCSGYVYGLAIAKGLICAKLANNVLLIVADTYSKQIYEKDIANRAIFGDGAAATIVSKVLGTNGIGEFQLGTDGAGKENLIVHNGAFRNPIDHNAKEIEYGTQSAFTKNHLQMNGPEIFNFTIEKIPDLVAATLKKNNIPLDEVDFFIFHQANKYMLDYLRRKTKIPKSKFYVNLTETGNTVSATIPIALKDCIERKLVLEGSKILIVGFGVGYSWGATLITL